MSNSTEFVLLATNAAGVFSRGVSVTVASNALPVRISEFVADNKYSLQDGYGDASDWIELRNPGDAPVNLAQAHWLAGGMVVFSFAVLLGLGLLAVAAARRKAARA